MRAPQGRGLRRHRIGLGHFAKEALHSAGWRERDQNPAAVATDVGPHVRYLARSQQRIARSQPELLLADFEDKLTFNHMEPLVLVVVQVSRRATLGTESVFENKQTATIPGGKSEGDRANAKSAMLSKAVFACRDSEHTRNASRSPWGFAYNDAFDLALGALMEAGRPKVCRTRETVGWVGHGTMGNASSLADPISLKSRSFREAGSTSLTRHAAESPGQASTNRRRRPGLALRTHLTYNLVGNDVPVLTRAPAGGVWTTVHRKHRSYAIL